MNMSGPLIYDSSRLDSNYIRSDNGWATGIPVYIEFIPQLILLTM